MKLLFFFLSAQLLCGQALGAGKIITFDASLDAAARRRLVESAGGLVIKDFDFMSAALAEFPAGTKALDAARLPGVAAAEDDEEIYWLASEQEQPSLSGAFAAAQEVLAGGPAPAQPPAVPPAVSTQPPAAPIYVTTASVDGKADHMSWGAARMRAHDVWPVTKGAGARVAVLDTGVDCAHPDLAPNCVKGYNVLNPRLPPDDDKGHGTHVSGIIAGALNWKGAVGMAPEASILPVKVLNSSGSGKVSEIIEGIGWAVKNKADIINMSLGASKFSEAQGKAVKAARAAGVLVIAAAGNDGGTVNYPAAFEESLAVTALGYDNQLAPFSCRGPETDFTAPGVKIFSSAPGGKFIAASGTSQAAPHVSGLAALAVALGIRGPDALEKALARASVGLGLPAYHEGYGVPVAALLLRNVQAAQNQPRD
ncbi:MAG: S8 family peptidase [Elusimicrobiales bacterium]|nr:S8 family peptidase [Elusimicrobiales bacterium]